MESFKNRWLVKKKTALLAKRSFVFPFLRIGISRLMCLLERVKIGLIESYR